MTQENVKNRLVMLKYFEYLGINNRVVMVKKYRYIKSRIHILCVCCLCFSKVFTVLKFPRSYFLTFFTMMSFFEVSFIQSSFSDTILWWLPSLTFLLKSSSPARILPHSNKNFWWIVDPQMKISFKKMIQEIRQTSVFDARRTTLFCPVCNRIFQQNSFLKCFFTRF